MYKNQLQELAQRSCFNLPSYTCIREGPDHAPRFKAIVNFNGETFESPHYCSTLRQAEHSAAEVALNSLSGRGPSHSLAARILTRLRGLWLLHGSLNQEATSPVPFKENSRVSVTELWDETGVYKNLLQEISQRVGSPLPQYVTFRSGLRHLPVFTGIVELAGITFTGEPAKNKKQAEKNAALAAWSSLKQLAQKEASSSSEPEANDEQEQIRIARSLLNYRLKIKMRMGNSTDAPIPFPQKLPIPHPRPISPQPPRVSTSKILPLICPTTVPRNRPTSSTANESPVRLSQPLPPLQPQVPEGHAIRPHRFPAAGAAPYVPVQHFRTPCHGIAPPVTIRTAVPVFSAPPPSIRSPQVMQVQRARIAPPVCIRQAVPVFAPPPIQKDELPTVLAPALPNTSPAEVEEISRKSENGRYESEAVKTLEQLKI
ncbi:unnamed protein product [Ilex paraguariensis]|uniref:DRBM domain-containing protein n=1 Tax=Ilex paraguariensis TaxID=185542 RepID=A0ABC8T6Z8_9AQUA